MPNEKFKNIKSIFNEKIFRIPDYQRGYAWRSDGNKEVVVFWNDLMNLSEGQSHFTGSLTLQEVPEDEKERVLKEDAWIAKKDYKPWFVVDGQQRLTTIIIFIQCLYEFLQFNNLESTFFDDEEEDLKDLRKKYLFKTFTPRGGVRVKCYLLGYDNNETSDKFLKNKIFGDNSITSNEESYYTLNMENAKNFFKNNIETLYKEEGIKAIQRLYNKVTRDLMFDLIEVEKGDDFNIFVAFETINNRGKQLSNLEKLKNRLIYLTTYCDKSINGNVEKTSWGGASVRKKINEAWSEIYRQLGRNTKKNSKGKVSVLSDDEFLRTHWVLYYQYSRKTGNDYIYYLLDTKFTVQNVLEKLASTDSSQEIAIDIDEDGDLYDIPTDSRNENDRKKIGLEEIQEYVINLQNTAKPWYYTYFPQDASEGELNLNIKEMMDRINRVGISYFRPLITALFYRTIVKKDISFENCEKLLKAIERFIFIEFRLQSARSNYGSSEFNRAAHTLHEGTKSIDDIIEMINAKMEHSFETDADGQRYFKAQNMQYLVNKLFENKDDRAGYYRWSAIHYFLYEYEKKLLEGHHARRVSWEDFKQNENDKISIEHIFPHKADEISYWKEMFKDIPNEDWSIYEGSLGNMLLLSQQINASLQNKDYKSKREGDDERQGYENGSCSEHFICKNYQEWTPEAIKTNGIKMLEFMEEHWNLKFKSEEEKMELLLPGLNSLAL